MWTMVMEKLSLSQNDIINFLLAIPKDTTMKAFNNENNNNKKTEQTKRYSILLLSASKNFLFSCNRKKIK